MENYEQKYKEIVERVKELHAAGNFLTKKQMEIILPQLAESEDEKVRKELSAVINDLVLPEEQRARFNAWLEKQKEQKPTEDWREKRKKECPFRRNLDNNLYGCERYADVVYACDGNCSWVVDYPKLKEIQDKKEQKPAEWSEEDARILYNVIAYIGYAAGQRGVRDDEFKEANAWLKSLPERFNLQPKQEQKSVEWSEEDEKDMAYIIRILDDCYVYGKHDLSKTDHENLVNKLKSLKPQPKQEWSSELTIKDLKELDRLYLEVDEMGFEEESDAFYKEVLKRFKKYKYGNAKEDTDINDTER